MSLLPLRSTLFPYTTLFRSQRQHARSALEMELAQRPLEVIEVVGAHLAPVRAQMIGVHEGRERTDAAAQERIRQHFPARDRKSTRLNSSHVSISYAVFCLKK